MLFTDGTSIVKKVSLLVDLTALLEGGLIFAWSILRQRAQIHSLEKIRNMYEKCT
jgi:hypothetical protein